MDVAASADGGRCLNKNPENIDLGFNRALNSAKFGFEQNCGKKSKSFLRKGGLSVFPIKKLGLSGSGRRGLITSFLYRCHNRAFA